ncbi:ankyrin repeat domain-containing protein [Flavobacterium procerum]
MNKIKTLLLVSFAVFISCNKKADEKKPATKSQVQSNNAKNSIENDIKKAIESNDESFVTFIDTTKNINKYYQFEDVDTYTILGYCCKFGRYDFVEKIIQRKADLSMAKEDEYYQYDALYIAIENQNEKIVDLLLEKKVDVNRTYTESGITPLSLACQYSNFHIIETLINHKANVDGTYNRETDMASIPILEAVMSKNKEAVKLLVEKGANINQIDLEGVSALGYAKTHNQELHKLLLSTIKPISDKFQGKFTVDTDGEYTNNGQGHTTYNFTISQDKINLEYVAFRGDFVCEGAHIGIEKNDILEVYYDGQDDRCRKYLIKKEQNNYFIKGVGGEGIIHEWVKLEKEL